MNIYIPEKIYKAMPLICFVLATLFLLVPPSIVKYICCGTLYIYAVYITFKRLQYNY